MVVVEDRMSERIAVNDEVILLDTTKLVGKTIRLTVEVVEPIPEIVPGDVWVGTMSGARVKVTNIVGNIVDVMYLNTHTDAIFSKDGFLYLFTPEVGE